MPCFGGADGKTLFVTSFGDYNKLPEVFDDPYAGNLIAFELEVGGVTESRF